jgi:hypothetical protein
MPFAASNDANSKRIASPLAPMCDVTGGKCHVAHNLRHAFHVVEGIGASSHTHTHTHTHTHPLVALIVIVIIIDIVVFSDATIECWRLSAL